MKSISMIHRTEKVIRISMGAGSNSVSTVGKWGIESSSAIDRKKEASIVAGRKKRKHGYSVLVNSCHRTVANGKVTSGERRKIGLGVRGT